MATIITTQTTMVSNTVAQAVSMIYVTRQCISYLIFAIILIALGGIALAGYIGVKMVGPQIETSQTLKESIANKELELDKKTTQIARRNERADEK